MSVSHKTWLNTIAVAGALVAMSQSVEAYTPVVPSNGAPTAGPTVMAPSAVYGKEYSHDVDFDTVAPNARHVMAWDGLGGVANGLDHSGSGWPTERQIDAVANQRDALVEQTLSDRSHLIFSHDDQVAIYRNGGAPAPYTIPSTGPVATASNWIGGAGEVSVERSGFHNGFNQQSPWASGNVVNDLMAPIDVDGLEVWGPEPSEFVGPSQAIVGDADKYSLSADHVTGASIWNASGSAYLNWSHVADAVESLLGPVPTTAYSFRDPQATGRQLIDLDAMMVDDALGEADHWDNEVVIGDWLGGGLLDPVVDQNGEDIPFTGDLRGDRVIFSIGQIVDPSDPTGDGYYATGSELFVLDSFGGASYLRHGGHDWDHAYALSHLAFIGSSQGDPDGQVVIDINAIEAIGDRLLFDLGPITGDLNDDGLVNLVDLDILGTNFGRVGIGRSGGDLNGDGTVDLIDLDLLGANFGTGGSGPSAAVPEPGALLLLACGAGLAMVRRR